MWHNSEKEDRIWEQQLKVLVLIVAKRIEHFCDTLQTGFITASNSR